MINVLIKYEDNKFSSIEVKGHANSDEYGKDLVCAAVSAVVTGAMNSINEIKNFNYEFKEGYVFLEKKAEVSSHDEVVIETMICSLRTIEESNSKFIKIKNL